MRLRHLFEQAPAKKVVAVMPGGFHPFHPGHKSLYDWAVETFGKENVYVAATNDTKSRPFPFDVKQKLAAMAGVPASRFMQVKSPFNALAYESIIGNPEETAIVFVRSEKDKTSHPLPDQIRKSDGMMGYLISYKGNEDLETADTHGYLAYGPTIDFDFSGMQIKSASELRAAWPEMSDEDKLQAAELMYPKNAQTAVQLLDKALGVKELEPEMAENNQINEALPTVIAAFATVGGLLLGGALAYQDAKLTQDWMEAYKEINLRDPDKAQEIKKLVNRYQSLNLKNQGIKNLTREKIEKIIADANPKPAENTLEAAYEGNLGLMELFKFFSKAEKTDPDLVSKVKELIKQGEDRLVWQIVQDYTDTRLVGKEFEGSIAEAIVERACKNRMKKRRG